MRKSIKSFVAMFIFVLGIFHLSTVAFAKANIPTATSDFYVNDFANVFSSDEKTRLLDNAINLSDEYDGIQVVITTVKSLDGDTIENYALEMYNQYRIGKENMGLLILLSTGDRQIRVEVGLEMEAYINDSKAGRFIDEYAIPSLKENKFDEGLINLQEALISEIITEIEDENVADSQPSNTTANSLDFFSVLGTFLFVVIAIVLLIFIAVLIRKIITKSKEKQKTIDTLTKKLEQSEQKATEIKNVASRKVDELQEKLNALSEDKKELTSNYQILENKFTTLKDRYRRIQILYPSSDKEVTEMIAEEIRQRDMSLARGVDLTIQKVIDLPASKDIVSKLYEAKSCYSKLSPQQRLYVKSDIDKLNRLYDESLKLKQEYDKMLEEERKKNLALAAATSITSIISCISVGKARNYRKLKEAKSIYTNLEDGVRIYFDKSVSTKLDKLYKEAKKDKEEEEEAERRRKKQEEEHRRRMQISSSSSFGSSSHYGGFGGHSGGGGASRGF